MGLNCMPKVVRRACAEELVGEMQPPVTIPIRIAQIPDLKLSIQIFFLTLCL